MMNNYTKTSHHMVKTIIHNYIGLMELAKILSKVML